MENIAWRAVLHPTTHVKPTEAVPTPSVWDVWLLYAVTKPWAPEKRAMLLNSVSSASRKVG